MVALNSMSLKEESETCPGVGEVDKAPLETYYCVWRSIEHRIDECRNLPPVEREHLVDQLTDCQVMVMDRMTVMKSRTLHDIFCKLAVWRWESLGVVPDRDQMSDPERLVYSAYRDLRDLLGKTELERRGDRPTPCCRDLPDDVKVSSRKSPPCGRAS